MGFEFGKTSQERLDTCEEPLIRVMSRAIEVTLVDFAVLCGRRTEEKQNRAFDKGHSKVKFPWSRHNKKPSGAVDVGPYDRTIEGRIPWLHDTLPHAEYVRRVKMWYELAGVIHAVAAEMNVPIEWGGRWSTIVDLPHWQLRKGN